MPRHRRRWFTVTLCLIAMGTLGSHPRAWGQSSRVGGTMTSALWGKAGELWTPQSRLPDFSYAGYQRGEVPLPDRAVDVSVKDYGAVGNGRTDDTAAFQKAIDENPGKVIGVPSGRYRITNIIKITKSGTVLKGVDPRRSLLLVPAPLERIRSNLGATTEGKPTSNYSWSGGILHVQGALSRKALTTVREPSARGDTTLAVEAVAGIQVGQMVRLVQQDPADRSLTRHIYGGDSGSISKLTRVRESFVAKVTAVDAGARRIEIDRPLRTDVRTEWSPRLHDAKGTVEEVGIEKLGFEFPSTPYQGHFTELGFNPVALSGVRNCYLRDLAFRNADSGPFLSGENITVARILYESSRRPDRRSGATGHHGITLGGADNLLRDFVINTRFIHDITVTRGSAGNVAMSGRGIDLALDHHRAGNFGNLWTQLDAGAGTRLYHSGGGADLGWHSGAWETFWNIRSARPQSWPPASRGSKWGPDLMNLVGLTSNDRSTMDPKGRWFEAIPPVRLVPSNLYEAQLARRLAAGKSPGGEGR